MKPRTARFPKRRVALGRVYGLPETGPVVLVATSDRSRANLMTMSWRTMRQFEPPLVGCVVTGRNFSLEALRPVRNAAPHGAELRQRRCD